MTLHWQKIEDCPDVPECGCDEPAESPAWEGQIVTTDCGGSGSSGSGSSGSPPSVPSGSDDCSDGECFWIWTNPLGGMEFWEWVLHSGDCPQRGPTCSCATPPGTDGTYYYEIRLGDCVSV